MACVPESWLLMNEWALNCVQKSHRFSFQPLGWNDIDYNYFFKISMHTYGIILGSPCLIFPHEQHTGAPRHMYANTHTCTAHTHNCYFIIKENAQESGGCHQVVTPACGRAIIFTRVERLWTYTSEVCFGSALGIRSLLWKFSIPFKDVPWVVEVGKMSRQNKEFFWSPRREPYNTEGESLFNDEPS